MIQKITESDYQNHPTTDTDESVIIFSVITRLYNTDCQSFLLSIIITLQINPAIYVDLYMFLYGS